ncbi:MULTISPECIES: class I SAM-dependent methyltransferase [unclassified Paenibacillus]|uniref:class I SAM-dependent methyltransferase n=1 Tax=unclassified Paenibacillus TaxID=185978 RepID=UPI001AEA37BA|nr:MULTISPECIES: class I SAM-dependent methyltransferase [unclassified Paenibacillus]MBP1157465.1 SAM-dependent methyltransferase [Paenibacillus sp. PvP091]MBP1171798.1 SAM-dependent methyltransferase [Paenibacillus sp. PvR098]MBP2438179.1 SAM-dependent methyltransferase [Paenibacillus sp. PvP052]
MNENVPGNYYDKYHTKNPIARYLMNGFLSSLDNCLDMIDVSSVLDAGCGEGEITNFVNNKFNNLRSLKGIELEPVTVDEANKRFPHLDITQGSIYELPFEDNAFDLVIACEVLEHLENPQRALDEIIRVSNKYILVSVPREPIWRICNMLRGKYITDLGNTPGHIQHWSKKQFISLIQSNSDILKRNSPFPWTMILAQIK